MFTLLWLLTETPTTAGPTFLAISATERDPVVAETGEALKELPELEL
jgi:hypothetical protein